MAATLKLERRGAGIELRRGPIDIFVDDQQLGSINLHEVAETALDPGIHTLQLRMRRFSSRPRTFDMADGEVVSFRCHAPMVWPRLLASLFVPSLGVALKRG